MPVVIPIIAAVAAAAASYGVGAFVVGLGYSALAGAIIGGLAGAVAAFAVSSLGNALFPVRAARNSAINDAFSRTQQFRQPITAHRMVVGRARVSGPIVFLYTNAEARTAYTSLVNGSVAADYRAEQLLYLCHVIAAHEISAIETVMIDNLPLTDEKWRGVAYVEAGAGSADQAASPLLLAETDGQWTSSHRLRGRAYLASVLKYDEAIFTAGVPNISAVARGALCYDPRSGATGWTRNAAIIVAWYLTSDFGLRASWDDIDTATLVASANICDEEVALNDGSTEARYTCNGSFDLDEAPGRVLERLCSAMAGTAVFVGGKWYVHAGAWSSPSDTITEDMLRGPVTVRLNRPSRDLFNGVRAVYVRPAAGWQPTDAPPLSDATALAADGGVESYTDLALDFTVSGYRAQRLMQIALRKNRLQKQIVAPLNLSGLRLRCMDVVTVSLPRLPEATYRVTGWALSPDGGVDVTLEEETADVWAWTPATDERALPAVAAVEFPSGATLGTPVVTVTTPNDPEPATIAIAWAAITSATSYLVEWREPGASVWTSATPSGTTATPSTAGVAGFRVQARGADDAYGLWRTVDLPEAPTGFLVVTTGGGYDVTVTIAEGTDRAQIFAGTTSTFSASTKLTPEPDSGTTSVVDASGVPKYLWVRGVGTDGNAGVERGPVLIDPSTTGEIGGWAAPVEDPSAGGGDGDSGAADGGTGDGDGGDGGDGGGGDGE